jgi:hypothetical protein
MKQNLVQAYKQAPWRIQLRRGILILIGVVVFVVVAIFYLNISAETYSSGIDILRAEATQESLRRDIADSETTLAYITSSLEMEKRAQNMGFITINDPGQMVYLVVPGYEGRQPAIQFTKKEVSHSTTYLDAEYTQSLWDVFFQGALKLRKVSVSSLP